MRKLSELKINERGTLINRLAPTNELIKEYENTYGIKLPDSYIFFLKNCNGGHPQLDTFIPVGQSLNNTWSVNFFYHLDSDISSPTSIWYNTKKWASNLGISAIPFASDSGDNQIVFDYKKSKIPQVKICIHDQCYKMINVADSFEEFIGLLFEDPDYV